MRIWILSLLLIATTVMAADLPGKKVVDLTYVFNEKTIYWPTVKTFHA